MSDRQTVAFSTLSNVDHRTASIDLCINSVKFNVDFSWCRTILCDTSLKSHKPSLENYKEWRRKVNKECDGKIWLMELIKMKVYHIIGLKDHVMSQ